MQVELRVYDEPMDTTIASDTTAVAPKVRKARCSNCRKTATFRIFNAFQDSVNGKVVCDSNVCFGLVTSHYPAQAKRID